MADVSAHDVCNHLLYQLKLSNLHFLISETPHSAQIVLRKRFLKEATGPAFPMPSSFSPKQNYQELEHQNRLLNNENDRLSKQIQELQVLSKSSKETAEILEQKILLFPFLFKDQTTNNRQRGACPLRTFPTLKEKKSTHLKKGIAWANSHSPVLTYGACVQKTA